MASKYLMTIGGKTRSVEVSEAEGRLVVHIDGQSLNADLRRVDGALHTLLLDSHSFEVVAVERAYGYEVLIDNKVFEVEVERADVPRTAARSAAGAPGSGLTQVKAPLTGTIIDVAVAPGDTVAQGQVMVIVESMKMNNELRAPRAGTIEAVLVAPRDRVERNAVVLTIA